jgi:hypothetical protein
MSANFRDALPGIVAPLGELAKIDWIRELNQTTWLFAIVETAHLLSMVVLGGAVLVLNLRLLGAILKDVPARTVEAATRPWLRAGIVGTIATGLYMGIATIVTLLPSSAFFVKMIALVAAILLSIAVSRQVQTEGGTTGSRSLPLALAAGALWLAGLFLFAATTKLSSGSLIVAFAGFVLFAATLVQYRRIYLTAIGVVLLVAVLLSLKVFADGSVLPGVVAVALALALAAGAGWLETRKTKAFIIGRLQASALSSSLAWITVAAAGRWIGFS